MIGRLRAVEFFSGMGSFAEACRDLDIEIVAAFDQDSVANSVYTHNFGLAPCNRTLDSIRLSQIPEADIWWMSPPCTPYSVRGKRDDLRDPRATSLLRLMQFVPERLPAILMLENVRGFEQSNARQMVVNKLKSLDYKVEETHLCSTDFGTPMRRPRYFLTASRRDHSTEALKDRAVKQFEGFSGNRQTIRSYLSEIFDDSLLMVSDEFQKYEPCLNVVDPCDQSAICICFTKSYYKCRMASGSLIQLPDNRVRRFSAREMLRLFGFSVDYFFPGSVSENRATGLLGNAVDVRMISHLLHTKVAPSKGSHQRLER